MKPLIILISSFLISLLTIYAIYKKIDYNLSGRIALSFMLLFTAIGHFIFSKGMTMMIPQFIPFKLSVVYLTGIIEIIFAILLLISDFKNVVGWGLIFFFLIILPANVHASLHQVNYQNANFNGYGLNYLWFRIPLQILFIIWTYLSTIRF